MNLRTTLVLAGVVAGVTSFASPINPNNLVLMRAESSATAGAGAVFLDEYTTAGVFVQSINVSSAGTNALTINKVGVTEGILSLSGNGSLISFGGYRTAVGGAVNTTTDRAVGTLDLSGNVNTSTPTLTSVTAGQALRSVATQDGTAFWLSVAGTYGVRYNSGAGGTSTLIDSRNGRQVAIAANELFGSNGSTAIANKLQSYGVPPTTATAPTNVIAQATADAIHGFMMLDLDASVVGADTAYAFNTVTNTLLKYSKVGGVWTSNGSVSAGNGLNLTAIKNGSDVELYANNSAGTTLMKLTDVGGGYNTALSSSATWSNLATVGSGFSFRGISSFKPVPEPASIFALALGAAMVLRRRQSK